MPTSFLLIIYNGNATDLIFLHQPNGIADSGIFVQGNRVDDQTAFTSFYFSHLFGLLFNAHVFMEDTHATFPGQCNGQLASVTVSMAAESMGILR